jgi:penicillin-binding protein 2
VRTDAVPPGTWQRRERHLTIVVATIFSLVLLRLFTLQVIQGERYRELSEENRIRVDVLTAPRGEIRDRNGRLIADSVPSFTVTVDPYDKAYLGHAADLDSTLTTLAQILDLDSAALREKVYREKAQSFLPVRLKRNVDMKTVAFVSEHRDRLPGVEVESEPLRRYPYGLTGSHLLGYVGEVSDKDLADPQRATYRSGDLIGKMGLEREYERLLRGEDGKRFVEVNALGRKAELLGDKRPILPRRGTDLRLTIDWRLQRAAEDAFDPGARGAIVVLDPRSGEVLALVSKPNYDPNEFSNGITQERWDELSQGGSYPLFNRAIQAAYPPGSTLKPFIAMAGLAGGDITEGTHFAQTCLGEYRFGSRVFGCWKKEGHGSLSLRDAVAQSCDVYFYQLGLREGLPNMSAFLRGIGIDERTGIDLPQERRCLFPDPAWYDRRFGPGRWSKGLVLNLAIGQGESSLTPIKLAQLTALVANGGSLVTPHLVQAATAGASPSRGGAAPLPAAAVPLPANVPPRDLNLPPRVMRLVRDAMEAVVEDPHGTGSAARIDSVRVAGKTGTAQNPHGKDHALFICFAPVESPEIAVAVLVENAGHGGSEAAPLAQKVLQAFFHPAPPESAAVVAGR